MPAAGIYCNAFVSKALDRSAGTTSAKIYTLAVSSLPLATNALGSARGVDTESGPKEASANLEVPFCRLKRNIRRVAVVLQVAVT